jgi:hypothetical protein
MAFNLPAFFGSSGGYDFANLTVGMIMLYAASFLLYRQQVISVRAHRMLWNILLMFTFLVSSTLGIILLMKINYGIVFNLPFNMLYWHVEAGIAMAVISVFHIGWHLPYFKAALGLTNTPQPVEGAPRGRKGGGG